MKYLVWTFVVAVASFYIGCWIVMLLDYVDQLTYKEKSRAKSYHDTH